MEQAYLNFHDSLNDFLAPSLQNQVIACNVNRRASIKDVIESYNVPHTEIDLIIVDGASVDFDYIVEASNDIHVYPYHSAMDHAPRGLLHHLSPPLPPHPRFIIDVNLGRLARYMRLLGFDCLYCNDFDDHSIAEISYKTQRIVLSRDRKLLQRKMITYGYYVRTEIPKIQVSEILNRFKLHALINPLTRCTKCNERLTKIEKHTIEHRLKPLTRQYYDKFLICTGCNQIYWQGSHHKRVTRLIQKFSGND